MVEKEFLKMSQEVSNCTLCELHTKRKNAVFGMGNPYAEIMIIGEGPGHEEDLQGVPFVGKSGQLLDKILSACGFTREEHVYIANIVKCRPPQNRDPKPEERDACLPWLFKQISIIRPRILVLLGATAVKGLIDPEARITKIRGKWMEWENFLVMPTYHPSALLRNPQLKKDSWEDFKLVVKKYREIIDPEHQAPNEI
ncbi:MAG: uracil-DNA glycosylase [Bacteroidota bacterium]|nr:uracil-DNA glycosylase [Bacteroidota bacterium]